MACLAVLALVATGAQAGGTPTPPQCTAKILPNALPDPLLGSAANKYFEGLIVQTPDSPGVLGTGTATNTGVTGSPLRPLTGNTFSATYRDEVEMYEFPNNAGTVKNPKSPDASDADQPILAGLPNGTVNHLAGGSSTGRALPYAVILSSDLKHVIATVSVTITKQNYTPNPLAFGHGTFPKDPAGQPKSTDGCELYSVMQFTSTGVASLQQGVTYAALLRVRDTDTSGPLANHLWFFTVPPKANPTVSTTASPSAANIGDSIKDTATVSGGNSPTGQVKFELFGPDPGSTADCSTTPAFTSTTGLSGTSATSDTFKPTAAGTYHWRATYLGDGQNNQAGPTACADSAEQVVVSKLATAITTAASSSVFLTQSITDTATVTGGSSPTGTVTFTLYGPSTTPDCTTAVAGTPVTAQLDGTGHATSPPVTPDTPGVYRWIASYGGDGTNAGAGPTACDDPAENVEIKPLPVRVFVAYADIGRTNSATAGAPNPWQGGAGVTFVGCGSNLITPFASAPCPFAFNRPRYDAGALRFDVTAGTIPLTFSDGSVSIGPDCTGAKAYRPWPGLNVTIQPGNKLILTQTAGNPANPCTDDPNFDSSEANPRGACTVGANPAKGVITITINGKQVTFTDNTQVLNTQGRDKFNCTLTSEFQDWTALS